MLTGKRTRVELLFDVLEAEQTLLDALREILAGEVDVI